MCGEEGREGAEGEDKREKRSSGSEVRSRAEGGKGPVSQKGDGKEEKRSWYEKMPGGKKKEGGRVGGNGYRDSGKVRAHSVKLQSPGRERGRPISAGAENVNSAQGETGLLF